MKPTCLIRCCVWLGPLCLIFSGAACNRQQGPTAAAARPLPAVRVDEVIEAEVTPEQTFVGLIGPVRTSVVGSAADGRVIAYRFPTEEGEWEVPVDDGQHVVADQPLVQLQTRTEEIELDGARAELRLRQEELAELENGSRPEEIQQARAAVERSEALRAFAASRLSRADDLYSRGRIASLEELQEARSSADAAAQSKREAEATLQLVLEGPRIEQIRQAEARVAMQQAEVDRLQDLLEKFTVRAPFDGYVVAKHAERGQWITRGAPIVELASAEVEVTVAVPEHYIGAIQPGDPVTVQVGALAARQFPATIDRIVPRADARARTFPVRIRLENPGTQNGHLLKGGMLARVTLRVDQPRRSLLVPKDALVLGGQQPLVFVVREDPQTGELKTVPVSVTLGVAQEHRTEVTGALEAGERVVVEGNERLRPGTIVRLMDSPAA